jgi:hypothetical protein
MLFFCPFVTLGMIEQIGGDWNSTGKKGIILHRINHIINNVVINIKLIERQILTTLFVNILNLFVGR